MRADLVAVAREAAARWRQDRVLLVPLSGLLLFVPAWAKLLFVPPLPDVPAGRDPAAIQAWTEAMQGWIDGYGLLQLAIALAAQLGQLAVVALYLAPGTRPTTGAALLLAARRLPRMVLVSLLVLMPVGTLLLASAGAPPLLLFAGPATVYALGRLLLAGAALVARPGTGAVRAVVLSWRWTRGHGLALALLVTASVIATTVAGEAAKAAVAVFGHGGGLSADAFTAAVDATAALVGWAVTLAVAMMQAVLYRRLAR